MLGLDEQPMPSGTKAEQEYARAKLVWFGPAMGFIIGTVVFSLLISLMGFSGLAFFGLIGGVMGIICERKLTARAHARHEAALLVQKRDAVSESEAELQAKIEEARKTGQFDRFGESQ